jgi:hypothetical protein
MHASGSGCLLASRGDRLVSPTKYQSLLSPCWDRGVGVIGLLVM